MFQILLVGPPYKRLDSWYSRAPLPLSKSIFLYDRRLILGGDLPQSDAPSADVATVGAVAAAVADVAQPLKLLLEPAAMPEELVVVTAAAAAVIKGGRAAHPLLHTISDYERQFMLAANRGAALVEAAEERRAACVRYYCFIQTYTAMCIDCTASPCSHELTCCSRTV
jgi:hypothetical protein